MKLPGGDRAIVDERKLLGYALDPGHSSGGPKARVFRSALGLEARHAPVLIAALKSAARDADAELMFVDEYGASFRIDFAFTHADRTARLRSGWKLARAGDAPYLTTVFVLR